MRAKSFQLCPTLCDPMDCSLPGFSVLGNSPGKNAGGVATPSSRELPDPEIKPVFLIPPALADRFFTTSATWETPYGILVNFN